MSTKNWLIIVPREESSQPESHLTTVVTLNLEPDLSILVKVKMNKGKSFLKNKTAQVFSYHQQVS